VCVCLILHVFLFPRHNPVPIVYISHLLLFSVFLPILQVIQCLCLIFHIFQFSCQNPDTTVCISQYFTYSIVSHHISGPTVRVSHFARFLVFFLSYFLSYHVSFSFYSFVTFLTIFQVLQCEFLIFLVGEFHRHITDPTVGVSHFSRFQCFSPYSM
jgi:hypothetical protein